MNTVVTRVLVRDRPVEEPPRCLCPLPPKTPRTPGWRLPTGTSCVTLDIAEISLFFQKNGKFWKCSISAQKSKNAEKCKNAKKISKKVQNDRFPTFLFSDSGELRWIPVNSDGTNPRVDSGELRWIPMNSGGTHAGELVRSSRVDFRPFLSRFYNFSPSKTSQIQFPGGIRTSFTKKYKFDKHVKKDVLDPPWGENKNLQNWLKI